MSDQQGILAKRKDKNGGIAIGAPACRDAGVGIAVFIQADKSLKKSRNDRQACSVGSNLRIQGLWFRRKRVKKLLVGAFRAFFPTGTKGK